MYWKKWTWYEQEKGKGIEKRSRIVNEASETQIKSFPLICVVENECTSTGRGIQFKVAGTEISVVKG